VEKYNDPNALQVEVARYLWTDGRVLAYTRHLNDGERFGWDDTVAPASTPAQTGGGATRPPRWDAKPGPQETPSAGEDAARTAGGDASATGVRVPRGQEVIEVFGVLESKVPLTARDFHQWPYCRLSDELDVAVVRALYPWVADQLAAASHSATGEDELARMARIGTAEGVATLSQDALAYLITRDRYWFRPAAFTELSREWRERMQEYFPDGCFVTFCGETYCESRNERLDDHIQVMHALPGDGQDRPSLGA